MKRMSTLIAQLQVNPSLRPWQSAGECLTAIARFSVRGSDSPTPVADAGYGIGISGHSIGDVSNGRDRSIARKPVKPTLRFDGNPRRSGRGRLKLSAPTMD